MEDELKVFTIVDRKRKLKQSVKILDITRDLKLDVRSLDEGFIVERKVRYRNDDSGWIIPRLYGISCTQVNNKETPSERIATIFESRRRDGVRYVAVLARDNTELSGAVGIACSLGLIPEDEYKSFLSE